jgi:hypothetical protein
MVKNMPRFPLQEPAKFTQIGIFSLKTNHLATLVACLSGAEIFISLEDIFSADTDDQI